MNKLVAICLMSMLCIAIPPTLGKPGISFERDSEHLNELIENHNKFSEKDAAAQPRHDDPVPVMIAKQGYPVETHSVTTEDDYILEMHRIPFSKKSPPVDGVTKPVVYLQHGLLCSSADWVMGIPEKFLGYILADAGYDVWMGNYRGNTYSRKHLTLNPDRDHEFWEFSWDHNGYYDIPAMINKIVGVTRQERMHYVGHSMGTTGVMVMLDKRPEYADRIIMANLLAPVAYVEHMKSPLRLLVPFVDSVEWIAEHLGDGEFLPSSWLMDLLAELVCGTWGVELVCESIMYLMCGFDAAQTNDTLLPTIMHHTPAGGSTFQMLQYAQEVGDGGFHSYDNKKYNQAHFNRDDPFPFVLENIKLPVSLYWSQNDWLADPADVLSLVTRLPNIFDDYEVPFEQWNHLDYLWGIDAKEYVYDHLMENMAKAQALESNRKH